MEIKFKKKGHKKLHQYSIIVLKKKTCINNVYQEIIGNYVVFKERSNIATLFLSKKKLNFWLDNGVCLGNKIKKILKLK